LLLLSKTPPAKWVVFFRLLLLEPLILHHQADFLTKSWGIGIDTVMLEPNMFV